MNNSKYEYEEEYQNNIEEIDTEDQVKVKPKHKSSHKLLNIILCASLILCGGYQIYHYVDNYIESTKVVPYTMQEDRSLEYYLSEVTKHPREVVLYKQIAKMYIDNSNFDKAISYLNSGLLVANESETEEINDLIDEYETLRLNTYYGNIDSISLSYDELFSEIHSYEEFALIHVSNDEPGIVFGKDGSYGIYCTMWRTEPELQYNNYKISYIPGTETFCESYNESYTGKSVIKITNEGLLIAYLEYDSNTYEGSLFMEKSKYFYNEQEMEETLSNTDYWKLKDGKVEFTDSYQSQFKEITFYEINDEAEENINNGHYSKYLS